MAFFDTQFQLQTSDVVGFTASQRTAVELQMCVSIAFEATWLYKNMKYPRYKNFYGYAQIMSGAFVVESVPLNHLNQEVIHWRDSTFGINETTGCYARAIASKLVPPYELTVNTVKLRQRYTSVRFRLLPGVIANVSLVYETAQPVCDGNVLEPDEKQGQPPLPNNSGASDNPRPSNQPGDEIDPSNNDGDDNPNDGKPDAPSAGDSAGTGTWKVFASAYDLQDRAYTFTWDTQVTDRNAVVTASVAPLGGAGNAGGKSDGRLIITVNGVPNATAATGFGMNIFTPFYR